jgi:hypothetical protein
MLRLKTEAEMRKVRADAVKEDSIEEYFVEEAKRHGCKQRKITPFYGPDGWPDRLCIWPRGGVTDWAELKRPKGGVFQPKQEQIHNELRALECRVYVLSTRQQVDEYFATRAKELRVPPPLPKRKGRKTLVEASELRR